MCRYRRRNRRTTGDMLPKLQIKSGICRIPGIEISISTAAEMRVEIQFGLITDQRETVGPVDSGNQRVISDRPAQAHGSLVLPVPSVAEEVVSMIHLKFPFPLGKVNSPPHVFGVLISRLQKQYMVQHLEGRGWPV